MGANAKEGMWASGEMQELLEDANDPEWLVEICWWITV